MDIESDGGTEERPADVILFDRRLDELAREVQRRVAAEVELQAREQQLSAREEQIRVILAGIGDAVIVADAGGAVAFVSPVAQVLTGWPEEQARGKPLGEVFRCAEDGMLSARSGGRILIAESTSPLDGGGAVVVFRATAERKQAERERLLRAEQTARIGAERLAARMTQLQTLTAALARSGCLDDVVEATLAHAPPALGAISTALYIHGADRTTLDLAGQFGLPSHVVERYRSVQTNDEGLLIAKVARTGQPAWVEGLEELQQRTVVAGQHAAPAGIHALAVLPLEVGGRVLGAMAMGFHGLRRLADEERSFALMTADQCAQALDRVLSHGRAERAAARTARLQEVTAALSEARTTAEVVTVVVVQGCAAVGAQRGFIGLWIEDEAVLETVQMVGYPAEVVAEWRRISTDAPGPFADVLRSGEALFFETAAAGLSVYPHLEARRNPNDNAFAAIPLAAHGCVLGAVGLLFDEPHRFDEEDRALMLALARQCAQALDRARGYEAEASARAAAEAANVAKDEFLSTLSHELRTPLTSILGWANILRTRALEPAAMARAFEIIERNARAQVQLVEDILDVSRIVAGKLRLSIRPVDPAAIVRTTLDVVRPAAEAKRVLVEAVIDDAVGTLAADPDRLQQIAWNLITNAIKFTPPGGAIEVRLDRHGEGVRLQVIDRGEGIDAGFLPHVFERFRQADASNTRSHGGLGLGLAIVKHLVELHHGTVTASSAGAGWGATFTVTLPQTPAAGDSEAAPTWGGDLVTPVTRTSLRLDGVRVVVVDDDPDARELLAAILQDHGATVTTAACARDALRAVELARPDVLLSDIGMPHEDGYTLLQQVRALAGEGARGIAALALTSYAGREAARRAEVAGFQRYLAKPVLPARLIDEVAWLAGRAGAS